MNETPRSNRDLILFSDTKVFFLDLLDGARRGHRLAEKEMVQIQNRDLTGHKTLRKSFGEIILSVIMRSQ